MTDTTTALAEKVQRLQDIEDIRALKHRYAQEANIINGKSGNLPAFAALFAEDATFDVGMGTATGPAEIEAMMKGLTTQWRTAMHYMLNPQITVKGDRAEGTIYGLFAFTTEDNPTPIWLSNIYTDSFVRTPQGWRFQSLRIENTFADPAFLAGYADKLK